MKNPDTQEIQAIAQVAVHNPRFCEWLQSWYVSELERLPQAVNNSAVAQGRCQVLGEIIKVIKNGPEMAAQSR